MQLILGDCLEKMKEIPDGSVDLIVTSPPYEDFNGAGYTGNTKDVLFLKLYSEFFDGALHEMYRILKDGGQLYLNLKNKTLKKKLITPHWIEFTDGFRLFDFKSYIIWKYAGSFDSSKVRYHNDYEIIYHISKGDIVLSDDGEHDPLSSLWYIPHSISNRLHPVQMPEKVAEKMVMMSSETGGVVLDPFMGSGTTGVVCKKLNRDFIGIELDPTYYKIAANRISSLSTK